MDRVEILGKNRIEDVRWLCSLSESELDLLISLKMLVLQRVRVIGHDALAKKFDLKMLRALGFILMESFKEQLKDLPVADFTSLDGCNLLKLNPCGIFGSMSLEELMAYVGTDKRKRIAELFYEDPAPTPKKKSNTTLGAKSN